MSTSNEDDEREYLYERASQYGEDSIKIVRLQKTADPLVSCSCAPIEAFFRLVEECFQMADLGFKGEGK